MQYIIMSPSWSNKVIGMSEGGMMSREEDIVEGQGVLNLISVCVQHMNFQKFKL